MLFFMLSYCFMAEQNHVIQFMKARDTLSAFRDHDWLYAPEADKLRGKMGDIVLRAGLDDDDVYGITFEPEGWADDLLAKHPELDPDFEADLVDPAIYCETGETITGIEENETGCITYVVEKEGRGVNDRVLLDVREESNPCILTGGNPFEIETLHGFGRLVLSDLATGEQCDIFLEPGVNVRVPTGVIYKYVNCGKKGSQLILRDTSLDFDLANEVTVQAMASALTASPPETK